MSEELLARPKLNYSLTGFYGGDLRGYCLQITTLNGESYLQLTKPAARRLIKDIQQRFLGEGDIKCV